MSILVLGLSKYYAANNNNNDKHTKKEPAITNTSSESLSSSNDVELKHQVPQTRRQEIDQN
jgi:hypothetical protein